jgi:hypothetical protein
MERVLVRYAGAVALLLVGVVLVLVGYELIAQPNGEITGSGYGLIPLLLGFGLIAGGVWLVATRNRNS